MVISLLVGGSVTAFADEAEHDATLIYGGDNKIVITPNDLNLFKEGLMPGSESTQKLWLRNDSKYKTTVSVRAENINSEEYGFPVELQEKLLDEITLKITVKLADGTDLVRYEGVASGVIKTNGDMTTSEGIVLGKLSAKGGAADMTVEIKAPTSLENEFQNAVAKVKWIFTCDAEKNSSKPGGGGSRPNGGDPVSVVSNEVIPDESTPLEPPVEEVPDEDVPLIDAPGTGPKTGDETNYIFWGAIVVLSGCCIIFLLRTKKKEEKR